ncbi:MAG: lytic transglycosylase F [Acidobacteriota bacterium]|nr:lytic transglycosylase F [Acidobacteriota bacterium]
MLDLNHRYRRRSKGRESGSRWLAAVAAVLLVSPQTLVARQEEPTAITGPDSLARIEAEFTGDLPKIEERRLLRVLISYSRTNYFLDFGAEHGFEYELLRMYEDHLNKGRKLSQKIVVVFIPVPLDHLLKDLVDGRGDIAAGGLTITDERRKMVAFAKPYIPNVREVVVSGADSPPLHDLDGLAGAKIWVRDGSSYGEHLRSLSGRLEASGKRPIDVVEAPEYLATGDLLEMANAGVFSYTVADEHIANAWATVLPNIVVHEDLAVNTGGAIAWAVRPDNPGLAASLDAFVGTIKKGTLHGNIFFNRYFKDSEWISNPLTDADQKRLAELRELFQKYGRIYGFDWLALAAMGYQESKLDQNQRNPSGAVGIMQMKPSTAADKNVDVTPIDTIENNIHAAAKYLAFLRDRYFSDPAIPDKARLDFAIAAYNAGPARIAGLRKEAAQKGYDPNLWFSNVETIAAARIGRETVTYVANINKYYMAYTDFFQDNLKRQLQIRSLESAPRK